MHGGTQDMYTTTPPKILKQDRTTLPNRGLLIL